jgi:hypothetical protein
MPSAARWVCERQLYATTVSVTCLHTGFQYPVEELSLEDKITICIMESYLDFKVSAVSLCQIQGG